MAIIRADIPYRRRHDIEDATVTPVECIVIEIIIRKEKWLYVCLYNPNYRYKQKCCETIDSILNVASHESISMVYIMGDMNIDMCNGKGSQSLFDTIELHGLTNLITEPTCFKSKDGTCLDIILTTNQKRVAATINVNTGISDFHHLVGFASKIHVPRMEKQVITYRSYKKFNENCFRSDVHNAPFHVADIFDDCDDSYWFHERLLADVIESHAPIKRKKPVSRPVPYMNTNLRKAFHCKAMTHKLQIFQYGKN